MALIECVPNVSEGRDAATIAALVGAASSIAGAHLLDVSSDPSHNRSVLTLAGDGAALVEAILALTDAAIPRIDLRRHEGVHPRMGAVDVVPFVPLAGATMDDCVALARATGARLAERFALPVFLYGEAATSRARRRLEDVRRDGFGSLAARMAASGGAPDFGPPAPHPSAGATAVGARGLLVAYNVELATDRLEVARTVAGAVRERDGGLPGVKALGLALPHRGIVQVSMNLTDPHRTGLREAYDAVAAAAARLGVAAAESELVGLAPAAALAPADRAHVRLRAGAGSPVLEDRLHAAGLGA